MSQQDLLSVLATAANAASENGEDFARASNNGMGDVDPAMLLQLITAYQQGGQGAVESAATALTERERDEEDSRRTAARERERNGRRRAWDSSGDGEGQREAMDDPALEKGGSQEGTQSRYQQGQSQDGTRSSDDIAHQNSAILSNLLGPGPSDRDQNNQSRPYDHGDKEPSPGERFQTSLAAAERHASGHTRGDGGDPGPSTSAARKRRRSDSPEVETRNRGGGQRSAARGTLTSGNWEQDADGDLDPELMLLEGSSPLQDHDHENDNDNDSQSDDEGDNSQDQSQDQEVQGQPRKRGRGGKTKKLDPAEALRRRKERNKKAAQISRDLRKVAQKDMAEKIRGLEGEHAVLLNKYQVLEHQYDQLAHERDAIKKELETLKRKIPPAAIALPDPGSDGNVITINGIPLNLDQYIALSSLRPRASRSRAAAPRAGQLEDREMVDGVDDDEEDDEDFMPSSPMRGDEIETPAADAETPEEDTTPKAAARQGPSLGSRGRGGDESGTGGDFTAETPEERDEEDYGEDDEHFEDEDMDDEELFLPIEDVPVPEGEEERIQAAYYQQASNDANLLQQLQQAREAELSAERQKVESQGRQLYAQMNLPAGSVDNESNDYQHAQRPTRQMYNYAVPAPPPQQSYPTTFASSTSYTPNLNPSPALNARSESLAAALSQTGFNTDPVAAKQLLDAYAVISSHASSSSSGSGGGAAGGPDRGYGLGRGEQREQDPAALMRQIMILAQSQQYQNQN